MYNLARGKKTTMWLGIGVWDTSVLGFMRNIANVLNCLRAAADLHPPGPAFFMLLVFVYFYIDRVRGLSSS